MMSNAPVCGNWSFSGARNGSGRLHPNAQRRGSAPDTMSYAYGQSFVPVSVNLPVHRCQANVWKPGVCGQSSRLF
jgi:hypothetical protein